MEKFYHAARTAKGCTVTVQVGMNVTELNPRFDLRNHSPDGFNWGYHGSGPAQLALAICADCLADDQRALGIYQWFKRLVIAAEQRTSWTMREIDIKDSILGLERSHNRREAHGMGKLDIKEALAGGESNAGGERPDGGEPYDPTFGA